MSIDGCVDLGKLARDECGFRIGRHAIYLLVFVDTVDCFDPVSVSMCWMRDHVDGICLRKVSVACPFVFSYDDTLLDDNQEPSPHWDQSV